MKTNSTVHRFLAAFLTLCLTVPSTAVMALADGKSGKKSYREGLKYEELQQWDRAAQEFALAVAAEPGNAEYKLHYARALQSASIMYMKQGDELAKQGDYASAYNAYRSALGYDPGNEMASMKMRSMLEIQKDQALGLGQAKYDPKTGNVKPISNEITVASKPRSQDVVQSISWKDGDFKEVIRNMARTLGLNVLFDESVRVPNKLTFELQDITMAKAFDLILLQNKMAFEQVDRKTIIIFADNPQAKGKFEKALVKTFYLGNIKTADARNVINSLLPGRQVGVLEEQKVIMLKGTPAELQLVQDMLESVDKNISEVVIDVEIYEVSHSTASQIGNQLASTPQTLVQEAKDSTGKITQAAVVTAGLSNLGGVGVALGTLGGSALLGTMGRNSTSGTYQGPGAFLGLPPTTLSLLQSAGNSKLLAKTQIHALDGQQNQTKVGQSVPVRTGTNYGAGGYLGTGTTTGTTTNPTLNTGLSGLNSGLFDNIQYKDVGLVIDVTPKITNEGYVEIKMKLETSNVEGSGTDTTNLTPTFTQRSLSTTSRIQDGVTSIVASINQERRNDTRAGVPVVGMVPILGRFFTTPKQDKSMSDIVITVTPHIIRATEIGPKDRLAYNAGSLTNAGGAGSGLSSSIEEVLNRAQQAEEQERRLIAAQRGLPIDPATGNTTIAQTPPPQTVPVSNSAVPARNNYQDNGLPAGPSGAATNFQTVSNTEGQAPRKKVVFEGSGSSGNQNYNSPAVTSEAAAPPAADPLPVVPNTEMLQPTGAGANPTLPNGAPPNGAMPPNGAAPNAAGATGADAKPDGEKMPDISEHTPQIPPGTEVRPASVTNAPRPAHVEKYIQEQQLKALKEQQAAAAAKRNSAPTPAASAVEYVPPTPRVNAPQALPKAVVKGANTKNSDLAAFNPTGAPVPMRIEPPKAGTVALSLSAAQARLQINKPVTMTLQVDSQSMLTTANLAVQFDPTKLEVKSVKAGDMFGKQPDLSHTVDNGTLLISINSANGKLSKASGRLIVIEFVPIAEGPAEVAINGGETRVMLTDNVRANITATSAQVSIGR